MDLAVRLSRGWPMPNGSDGPATPVDSLILSYEDDASDTLRPRVEATGGDSTRVHHIVGVARASFLVAPHPERVETSVLASVKTNLGAAPPSLMFHKTSATVDSARSSTFRRPASGVARGDRAYRERVAEDDQREPRCEGGGCVAQDDIRIGTDGAVGDSRGGGGCWNRDSECAARRVASRRSTVARRKWRRSPRGVVRG
jgi:hypothetical protein